MGRRKKNNPSTTEKQAVTESLQSPQQGAPAEYVILPVQQQQQCQSSENHGDQGNKGTPATQRQQPTHRLGTTADSPNLGEDEFPVLGGRRNKKRGTPPIEHIPPTEHVTSCHEQLLQLHVSEEAQRVEQPTTPEHQQQLLLENTPLVPYQMNSHSQGLQHLQLIPQQDVTLPFHTSQQMQYQVIPQQQLILAMQQNMYYDQMQQSDQMYQMSVPPHQYQITMSQQHDTIHQQQMIYPIENCALFEQMQLQMGTPQPYQVFVPQQQQCQMSMSQQHGISQYPQEQCTSPYPQEQNNMSQEHGISQHQLDIPQHQHDNLPHQHDSPQSPQDTMTQQGMSQSPHRTVQQTQHGIPQYQQGIMLQQEYQDTMTYQQHSPTPQQQPGSPQHKHGTIPQQQGTIPQQHNQQDTNAQQHGIPQHQQDIMSQQQSISQSAQSIMTQQHSQQLTNAQQQDIPQSPQNTMTQQHSQHGIPQSPQNIMTQQHSQQFTNAQQQDIPQSPKNIMTQQHSQHGIPQSPQNNMTQQHSQQFTNVQQQDNPQCPQNIMTQQHSQHGIPSPQNIVTQQHSQQFTNAQQQDIPQSPQNTMTQQHSQHGIPQSPQSTMTQQHSQHVIPQSPQNIMTQQHSQQITNSQQHVNPQRQQVIMPQKQGIAQSPQGTMTQKHDQQPEQQVSYQTDLAQVKTPTKGPQLRVQEQKKVDVEKEIEKSESEEEPIPANFRRGGTKGRKIQVLANHFPLHLSPNITTAYQYDVTIEPDKPKSLLPVVMKQMQRTYYQNNNPAYDGMKNLISAYELPLPLPFTGVVKVMEEEREKEYSVKIQLATIVDLTALTKFFNQRYENQMTPPMHVLQCLDIVLRSRPSTTMIISGRSYFSVPEQIVKLGNGMEMYSGFYQSAILGWKPFLNVDVSHKAFPSNLSLLELIKDIDRKADLTQNLTRFVESKLSKLVYNLKIEYKLPGNLMTRRTYRCHGLEKSANAFIFIGEKGTDISVTQYFKDTKKYKLKYPHLPCLWVGNKQKKPKVVLPMELCTLVADQVTNKKMDEMQTRNIIRNATTSTYVRKDNIYHSMKVANHNVSPVMQEFGLSVDANMTEVTARVLPPPTMKYSNGIQPVVNGVWKGGHFQSPATLNKWAILCLDPGTEDCRIHELKDHFIKQGRLWKMMINPNVKTSRLNFDHIAEDNIANVLYQQFTQYHAEQVQLIVVILNERRTDSYNHVKRIAETATGCMTQCLRPSTMQRLTLRTIDNILQKANVKLNGVNFVWSDRPLIMMRPTMIMGADVTHPGPDSRENCPSVAAVTASQDPQAAVYNILFRLQDPRVEIIADLESITRSQLMTFYEKTHFKPEKIVFYRDGVSDGQFETVRRMEIQAVRKACTSLSAAYKPAITFLVVQKRHHTRLFPCNSKDAEDKNGNVPAGTCVDTNITHPISQDFYLVSHASVQGVAKPTKYRTIWDDSDLSDDDIEQLTYYLCHMYARCNRSVSYPAPTYYAHLAAARAKAYIDEAKQDMSDIKKLHDSIRVMKEIQVDHPMFFI